MLYALVFVVNTLQAKSLDRFGFRLTSFGFNTLNEGLISKGNLLTHKASKSKFNFTICNVKMKAIFE
jgi:hypothetical protein